MGIYVGKEHIMNVYDVDAEAEMITRSVMAEYVRLRIITAIDLYREERSQTVLLKNLWEALIAIVITFLVLIGFLWLTHQLNKNLQNRIKKRIESVESLSFKLIRSDQLWKTFNLLIRTIKVILIVLLLALLLNFLLGLFPWTRGIATYTVQLFIDTFSAVGQALLNFLPHLVILIIIFLITRYLLKLLRLFFEGVKLGGIVIKNFESDWAIPTYNLVRLTIIIFTFIFAYPHIPGSNSNAFKGVSVFLGILFSLGSTSFVANVIAGYSIIFRNAFKKGDRILVNDQIGIVEEQTLMLPWTVLIRNAGLNCLRVPDPSELRWELIHTDTVMNCTVAYRYWFLEDL